MTDRLTIRNSDGSVSQPTDLRWAEALEKLADYEDTGLAPKDVPTAHEMAQIFSLIEEVKAYRAMGVPLSRLYELAAADKEGRIQILHGTPKPLVWGDKDRNSVLCPSCGGDLMGGFELDPEAEMYQCPYCGQPINAKEVRKGEKQ